MQKAVRLVSLLLIVAAATARQEEARAQEVIINPASVPPSFPQTPPNSIVPGASFEPQPAPSALPGQPTSPRPSTGLGQPGQPAFSSTFGNQGLAPIMNAPGQPNFYEGFGFNNGAVANPTPSKEVTPAPRVPHPTHLSGSAIAPSPIAPTTPPGARYE
jgi:hypothetical protein